jgi:sulfatase maturation enzyme AslB (radical SAM superfamily)
MLCYSMDEMEQYTKSLCSERQYQKKLDNFKKVEDAFDSKTEHSEGLPIQLYLEPAGSCNLFCPICPTGRQLINRSGFLSFETFENVFNLLHETLTNIVISGWGEPLLNRQTTKMIEHASKNAVPTFMNTNGTIVHERVEEILDSQLTLINISLDGAASQSYHLYNEKYPFTKVVKGVESLREKKDKGNYIYPFILGHIIVTEETVDELEYLQNWALNIGVERVRFKRRHNTMPGKKKREKIFSGPDFTNFTKVINNKKVNSSEKLNWSQKDCSHPWDAIYLSCTGEMGICSWDPDLLLNLNHKDDFMATWNGNFIKKVRRWHSGKEADIGQPCSQCNRLPGYLRP